jgi:acetyltransferase-like isoleucine patch superfamily enzyme
LKENNTTEQSSFLRGLEFVQLSPVLILIILLTIAPNASAKTGPADPQAGGSLCFVLIQMQLGGPITIGNACDPGFGATVAAGGFILRSFATLAAAQAAQRAMGSGSPAGQPFCFVLIQMQPGGPTGIGNACDPGFGATIAAGGTIIRSFSTLAAAQAAQAAMASARSAAASLPMPGSSQAFCFVLMQMQPGGPVSIANACDPGFGATIAAGGTILRGFPTLAAAEAATAGMSMGSSAGQPFCFVLIAMQLGGPVSIGNACDPGFGATIAAGGYILRSFPTLAAAEAARALLVSSPSGSLPFCFVLMQMRIGGQITIANACDPGFGAAFAGGGMIIRSFPTLAEAEQADIADTNKGVSVAPPNDPFPQTLPPNVTNPGPTPAPKPAPAPPVVKPPSPAPSVKTSPVTTSLVGTWSFTTTGGCEYQGGFKPNVTHKPDGSMVIVDSNSGKISTVTGAQIDSVVESWTVTGNNVSIIVHPTSYFDDPVTNPPKDKFTGGWESVLQLTGTLSLDGKTITGSVFHSSSTPDCSFRMSR